MFWRDFINQAVYGRLEIHKEPPAIVDLKYPNPRHASHVNGRRHASHIRLISSGPTISLRRLFYDA